MSLKGGEQEYRKAENKEKMGDIKQYVPFAI